MYELYRKINTNSSCIVGPSFQFVCLRNVFNTEWSYGKPLQDNFGGGELCTLHLKEKMKNNVAIRLNS